MNRKELHDFIKEKQPNICQISCYKDGKEVYSDEWNNYKKGDACHVMSATKSIVAFVYKTGLKNSVDGAKFKPQRKNARGRHRTDELCSHDSNEVDKMCSDSSNDTCGDYLFAVKGEP